MAAQTRCSRDWCKNQERPGKTQLSCCAPDLCGGLSLFLLPASLSARIWPSDMASLAAGVCLAASGALLTYLAKCGWFSKLVLTEETFGPYMLLHVNAQASLSMLEHHIQCGAGCSAMETFGMCCACCGMLRVTCAHGHPLANRARTRLLISIARSYAGWSSRRHVWIARLNTTSGQRWASTLMTPAAPLLPSVALAWRSCRTLTEAQVCKVQCCWNGSFECNGLTSACSSHHLHRHRWLRSVPAIPAECLQVWRTQGAFLPRATCQLH